MSLSSNYQTVSCDICQSRGFRTVYSNLVDNYLLKPGLFNYVQCWDCGLVYLNPRPSASTLPQYYQGEYIPYGAKNAVVRFIKKILWLPDKLLIKPILAKGGKLLEVGSARGDFLAYLGRPDQVFGLELDAPSAETARNIHGLSVITGTFEEHDFGNLKFDIAVMFFVLEHMLSPKRALEKLNSIMNPAAIALISVPNFDSWERIIFGRYWSGFDAPRHFYIFGEKQFKRLAESAGFRVLKVKYSLVPNDWLSGIKRLLTEKGYPRLARFFGIYNLILAAFFLPLAITAKLFGKSTRFMFIIQRS